MIDDFGGTGNFLPCVLDKKWSDKVLAGYPTRAVRPAFSALDTTSTCAALGLKIIDWRLQLRRMLTELKARG